MMQFPVRASLVMLTLLAAASAAVAGEPAFRRHAINPQSQFCAAAVLDVNRDGKLDIVNGGWWYAAPDWKKHLLREVPMIRGRYDDYSALPIDVNRDGWPDLISANYRSEMLFWIEHPGQSLGPWTVHGIEKPGPMETARLYDIDGDGQLDVLPNLVKSAAWWEVSRTAGSPGFVWVRHDLPAKAAGHGIGFGDINGDGRADIVTPGGWLEAPQDRRRGEWRWHADFTLHRDASVPILVHDVDSDGDHDLVYGRGHNIGLYWLEQIRDGTAVRWTLHAIDTSWSEAHSPLLADVDNDGRLELVVGKRYLGHDGRDPGEYDPLAIYWYKFQPAAKTWRRGVISQGGEAGFGLDPKAADLDGDGDVDLICPGRSGLYWMENLLIPPPGGAVPDTPLAAPAYSNHTDLLICQDAAGAPQPVQTPGQSALRRAHSLAAMERVMGELPDPSRRAPLDVQTQSEQQTARYTRIKLSYTAEPGDRVPAYLLLPKGLKGTAPAVLCLHQTIPIGKDEPAGLGSSANLHYAHELAERGFVCLAPDYPSFGEYSYDFRAPAGRYCSGTMKAIWNNLRAVDLLESLPQVDRDRIACIGHSLGAHNALFTAAFDQRIRAVISSCGFTGFHDYYGGKLAGWTSDRYMPRIRDVYHNDPDRMPFDFSEVLAALAPRPVFINAPQGDGNFDCAGVKKVVAAASAVYKLRDAAAKLHAVYPDCGHDFPEPVRQDAYRWLEKAFR